MSDDLRAAAARASARRDEARRGPIARALARARAREAEQLRAIAQDARRPTLEPGPGVRRVDGSRAVWPAPGWGSGD